MFLPPSTIHVVFLVEIYKLAMVSLRRRRLLGLPPGVNSYHLERARLNNTFEIAEYFITGSNKLKQFFEPSLGSSNFSGYSSSQEFSQYFGPEMKRRKKQRRKPVENQEPCLMRGVYFKNMKWQAAIKVEKKQIHLGTVGSQKEAAHLYDRAAFMCGREPNFELPEEEKAELRLMNWDEFLNKTRNHITNKKQPKKSTAGPREWKANLSKITKEANAQFFNISLAAGVSNS